MKPDIRVYAGLALNQAAVLRSLRERGYYDSGIPRTDGSTQRTSKKKAASRLLSSRELRYFSPEDLARYIADHS